MTQTTKRRGRPAGTDYKQDNIALKLVAERMLAEPSLKPTQAMRAVFKTGAFTDRGYTQESATVARWLVKWQTMGDAALAAAKDRRDRQSRPAPVSHGVTFRTPAGHYLPPPPPPPSPDLLRQVEIASRTIEQFERAGGRAVLEAAAEVMQNSAVARATAGLPSHPVMGAIAEGQSSMVWAANSAKSAMRVLEAAGGASHLRELAWLTEAARKFRGF